MDITLTTDQLWDCIYAARMQERYWKLRRRQMTEGAGADVFTHEELCEKINDSVSHTQFLESLAPEESF